MNKDNKNTKVNDTDKKLHISDVSSSDYITQTELLDFLSEYRNRVSAVEAGINIREWTWNEKSLKVKNFLGW